ncbi:tetratricopeptide repeat protein [Streptomyces cyaneofuscatus]|uniref:tetratricopeptide repeat protein n=1 Tax=Streptomyces cyaneofuscatus TaxID=66883 RepID=UPI0036572D13
MSERRAPRNARGHARGARLPVVPPTYTWPLASRGEAYRQAGRYDQAITDYTAALELDPTDARALASRSQAHRQAGHREEARMDVEQAAETHPDNRSCAFEKLMLETVEGRFETFRKQWRQLLTFATRTGPRSAQEAVPLPPTSDRMG